MVEAHLGISCKSCKASPIRGARFKCTVCPNVNLCVDCYALRATVHPDHELVRIETMDYLEPSRSASARSSISLADSGRHLLQEALIERELADQDLIVELERRSPATDEATPSSLGLSCAPDEDDPRFLLIEDIQLRSPAAEWNDRQDRSQPWGTFMLIGDEIKDRGRLNGRSWGFYKHGRDSLPSPEKRPRYIVILPMLPQQGG